VPETTDEEDEDDEDETGTDKVSICVQGSFIVQIYYEKIYKNVLLYEFIMEKYIRTFNSNSSVYTIL
jgi:hypothetical protein